MRLLLNENTPYSLARDLIGYQCSNVDRLGWKGTQNGALLARAEKAEFDVLITIDDDIKPEQNMPGRRIAVLVLKLMKQGKKATRAIAPKVLAELPTIQPGEIRVVA